MNVSEFLEARITEDEELAREASRVRETSTGDTWAVERGTYEDAIVISGATAERRIVGTLKQGTKHIARHDPARVLAECTAKRAILSSHEPFKDDAWVSGWIHDYLWCSSCGSTDDSPAPFPCDTLKAIAAVYKDHPDYQQEWAHGDD